MPTSSSRWDGKPIVLEPIGRVRSPHTERVEAPRQPRAAEGVEGTVELFSGHGLEDALSDLARWDHIWLVVWFDRNLGFRPKVLPPRSRTKRGVLATRAPYRPNPVGMSAVKLERVDGLTLWVRGLDLLDGTPVIDIKPYVPYTDAIPGANHGWLEDEHGEARAGLGAQRPTDPIERYTVVLGEPAGEQLRYLREEHGLNLWARIEAVLELGPQPHAYRRIRRDAEGYCLAIKDWRARFSVDSRVITVDSIASGYKPRELATEQGGAPSVHRLFVARWAPRGSP